MPEVELNTFAKNESGGVAKGAAEGFLEAVSPMGNCSGAFCGIAFILWLATAGTAGAVYGGIQGYLDALPAEEAKEAEQSIAELSVHFKIQERISEQFLRLPQKKTTKKLIAIEKTSRRKSAAYTEHFEQVYHEATLGWTPFGDSF